MAYKPCLRPRGRAACRRQCLSLSTCARARSMAVGSRVDSGARSAKKAGETDERLFAVAAWREAPYFTDAERAALALTEAVTRLSDRADPVPDEIWDEAARHYDERLQPPQRRHQAGSRCLGLNAIGQRRSPPRRLCWSSGVAGSLTKGR